MSKNRTAENEEDLRLLREAPGELLAKYQYLLEYFVRTYAQTGFFPAEHLEDIVQDINEKLWSTGLPRMQEKYDGRSLVKTYFGVIVRGFCNDKRKEYQSIKSKARLNQTPLEPWHDAAEDPAAFQLHLERELRRLEFLLGAYRRSRAKLEFSLRLFIRDGLSTEDLKAFAPELPDKQARAVIGELTQKYAALTDKELFSIMTPVYAAAAGKALHPDSLRKWTSGKIAELITLLNGDPPIYAYNEERLAILLSKYFETRAL